ncbi:hypothetical protein DP939_22310 [Spongiactinospora rosea]|uniref:Uncharacterized protein n=1 Tax=Spongiactinospora rosea TaxID=2248750 RepID=A0A366LVX8_9ACTN|nr:hypothetical protein DP939_22310 [Spongiactinospora rosea]
MSRIALTVFVACGERVRRCREIARQRPDGGYTTETVVVVAILVAIAVAVGAVLMSKLLAKANSLDLR